MNDLKMLSLFSGIGAFELVAKKFGIETVACSEIEPNALSVLKRHFPEARQLGDITKISGKISPEMERKYPKTEGGAIAFTTDLVLGKEHGQPVLFEPVDVVVGGWPCVGLSVAGKRGGLADERSGLFYDYIRVIQEMLESTNNTYPKFIVTENVPGLLSSNKGEDFKIVMDSLQNLGDGFALDINILDAQEYGVPQRRKRVFIVAVNKNSKECTEIMKSQSSELHELRPSNIKKALNNWGGETIVGLTTFEHEPIKIKLSDILVKTADKKYELSERACTGIMRRAEKRGKKLPVLLELALRLQCGETDFVLDIPEKDESLRKLLEVSGYGETGFGYWQNGLQTLRAEGENRPSRPSNVIVTSQVYDCRRVY